MYTQQQVHILRQRPPPQVRYKITCIVQYNKRHRCTIKTCELLVEKMYIYLDRGSFALLYLIELWGFSAFLFVLGAIYRYVYLLLLNIQLLIAFELLFLLRLCSGYYLYRNRVRLVYSFFCWIPQSQFYVEKSCFTGMVEYGFSWFYVILLSA